MILCKGRLVDIPGITGVAPGQHPKARLNSGDYTQRKTTWVRAATWHTTKGIWPQTIIPGAGPAGAEFDVADFFAKDVGHAGAAINIGFDGHYACLVDVYYAAVYHATTANDYTIGIEVCQRADGALYEAQLRTVGILGRALSNRGLFPELHIPWQHHGAPYQANRIVERLKQGGPDVCGHYGHRDQAWKFPHQLTPALRAKYPDGYANRGRGDPGDFVMNALGAAGSRSLDYHAGEDLALGRKRQQKLVEFGAKLTVDGVFGPASFAAMERFGFASGAELDTAVERPL